MKEEERELNGHSYVDLGLSVKWATCNVGASSPEDYGDYFSWGKISPRSSFDEAKWDDEANWGSSWRLPTKEEFQELIDNCEWTWTTLKGKAGYKVVSKKNGNSIFLPAAGRRRGTTTLDYAGECGDYWSPTPDEDGSSHAYYLGFYSSFHDMYSNYHIHPYLRRTLRPVSEF